MKALFFVLLFLAVLAVAFFAIGPRLVWQRTVGSPDLGEMNLAALVRTEKPHDGLACTQGLCGGIKTDLVLPRYDMTTDALMAAIDQSARRKTPGVVRVDDGSDPLSARYVTFSKMMKFPDTTWVQAVAMDDGQSGLRIYARAQIGYSDRGQNAKRIANWTSGIGTP